MLEHPDPERSPSRLSPDHEGLPGSLISYNLAPCQFDAAGISQFLAQSIQATGYPPLRTEAWKRILDLSGRTASVVISPTVTSNLLPSLPHSATAILTSIGHVHRIGLIQSIELAFRNELVGRCTDPQKVSEPGCDESQEVEVEITISRAHSPYFGGVLPEEEKESESFMNPVFSDNSWASTEDRRGPLTGLADQFEVSFKNRLAIMSANLTIVFDLHHRFLKFWKENSSIPGEAATLAFLKRHAPDETSHGVFLHWFKQVVLSAVTSIAENWSDIYRFEEDESACGGYALIVREQARGPLYCALMTDALRQWILIRNAYLVAGDLNEQMSPLSPLTIG